MTGRLLKQMVLPLPILRKMADCGGGDPYQSGGRWGRSLDLSIRLVFGKSARTDERTIACNDDAYRPFALSPVLLTTENWRCPAKERISA